MLKRGLTRQAEGFRGGSDHRRRGAYESAVVCGRPAVRKDCCILETRPDSVTASESVSVHCLAGYSIPVMNLLVLDAGLPQNILNGRRVSHGLVRLGIQRLDQNAHASIAKSR